MLAMGAIAPIGWAGITTRSRAQPVGGQVRDGEGMAQRITLTSVDGLEVGHQTRAERPTGCSVVIAREGASAGVSVEGSAPGTRETDLLDPRASVQLIHAVMLSGGSAFGLAAADGAVRYLKEHGVGFDDWPGGPIPIVPGAILFDLGLGGTVTPDADDGYAACANASSAPEAQGNVGAGAGATVGKLFRGGRMKGGIGSAGYRFDDGTVVAAMVAVNCLGDVRDPATGRIVAGSLDADGNLRDAQAQILAGGARSDDPDGGNTTIGVVATNRTLDKTACSRLARIAHDGLARAVTPAHTRADGDTFFFMATNRLPAVAGAEMTRIDIATAVTVSDAILAAVTAAESVLGIPAARDIGTV